MTIVKINVMKNIILTCAELEEIQWILQMADIADVIDSESATLEHEIIYGQVTLSYEEANRVLIKLQDIRVCEFPEHFLQISLFLDRVAQAAEILENSIWESQSDLENLYSET